MQLVIQSGAEPGRVYDLTDGSLSVGRQSINEIVVNDEQVSRKHARVDVTSQGIVVTDNNSANGTFVNGTRISSPYVLKVGDTVQFGTTILKMVESQGSSATVPTAFEQPAPSAYAQPSSYGSPAASSPPAYYNEPAPQNYGQQPAQSGYAQPNNYAAAPADYNQQGGGYGQPNNYAQPGGYNTYGQQPAAQAGYAPVPAPAAPKAKKGGMNPLILVIIAAVVVIAAVASILFFVLGSGGGVGDLPAPKNATKLDISVDDFKRIVALGGQNNVKLDNVKISSYTSTESAASLNSFYKTEMEKKGWKSSSTTTNGLLFEKGDQAAAVSVTELKDDTTAASIALFFPNVKDKIKKGDTLVFLITGPDKDLKGLNV